MLRLPVSTTTIIRRLSHAIVEFLDDPLLFRRNARHGGEFTDFVRQMQAQGLTPLQLAKPERATVNDAPRG